MEGQSCFTLHFKETVNAQVNKADGCACLILVRDTQLSHYEAPDIQLYLGMQEQRML